MSTGREVLAAICLLVQAGSAVAVALLLCRRVATDRLERALTAVALFFIQAIGLSVVLAMLTILSLPTALLAHVATLAVVLWFERKRLPKPAAQDDAEGWSIWGLVAVGFGSALLLLAANSSLRGPITNDFDTREYHITNMAHWLQDGNLWTLPYAGPGSITATHPGNGELFDTWLALPTHGDEIAYFGPSIFGVLAVLAAAVVARQLGGRKATANGALFAVAVLSAPMFFVTQIKSLSSDLPSAAPLIAGLAFTLIARKRPTVPLVLLAGASFGLGLGAKYTALAPGAIAVIVAVILLPGRKLWAWLVPGLAVLGLPWFVRNLAQTGNPLFPLDLPLFEGGQTPIDILDQSMLHHFREGDTDIIRNWAELIARFIGPVLILVIPGVLIAWKRLEDKKAAVACSVLAVLAVGAQIALPYTGGGETGLDFLIASCFRYGLAAVLFGAVVAAAALPAQWTPPLAGLCVLWGLWRIEAGVVTNTEPIRIKVIGGALAGGMIIAAALWFLAGEERRWRKAPDWLRRNMILGTTAVVVIGALGAGFVVFHKEDRGDVLLPLEVVMQPLGWDTPALVLGAEDMRAVLGPRLERRVHKVDRGGHAGEIPFVTVDQIRREILGDEDAPDEPPELAEELTEAVDASGYEVLVIGHGTPIAVPEGWEPSDKWCEVGRVREMIVYATRTVLGLGADASCPAP